MDYSCLVCMCANLLGEFYSKFEFHCVQRLMFLVLLYVLENQYLQLGKKGLPNKTYEGRSEINASYLFPWKLH